MTIRYLNPVQEAAVKPASLAPRLPSLEGCRLGLLSNGKENADALLQMVAQEIKTNFSVKNVVSVTKFGAGINCPPKFMEDLLSRCDAVITAVGD